jgi:hypothetical protein
MKSFLVLGISIVLLAASSARAQPQPKPDACENIITQTEGRKIQNCLVFWMPYWKVKAMKIKLTPEQTALIKHDEQTGYTGVPMCPPTWIFATTTGYWKVDGVMEKKPQTLPYCWRSTPADWVEPAPEQDAPAGDDQRRNRN